MSDSESLSTAATGDRAGRPDPDRSDQDRDDERPCAPVRHEVAALRDRQQRLLDELQARPLRRAIDQILALSAPRDLD